jgi:hypothetical protein
MITAIQALPSIDTIPALAALGMASPSAQQANSLLIVPDVILSLGTTWPPPITYSATGLLTSFVQSADPLPWIAAATTAAEALLSAPPAAPTDILQGLLSNSITQSIGNPLATDPGFILAALPTIPGALTTAAAISNAVTTIMETTSPATGTETTTPPKEPLLAKADLTAPATAANSRSNTATTGHTVVAATSSTDVAPVAAAPVEAITESPTTAAPDAVPAPAGSTAAAAPAVDANGASGAAIALANSLLVDSVAQARANIEGNPAYASAVAGLYMSAAIFQAQQAVALASTADSVQPIGAVPGVAAVKAVGR